MSVCVFLLFTHTYSHTYILLEGMRASFYVCLYTLIRNLNTHTHTHTQACELELYVSWTGTDARGNYLTSSSRRFSLFSAYSVESYLNGLRKGIMGISVQNADG